MQSRPVLVVAVAMLLISVVTFTAYRTEPAVPSADAIGSHTTPNNGANLGTSAGAPPDRFTVTMNGTAGGAVFVPAYVTVSIGATVTWLNPDTEIHTVTSYNSTVSGKLLFDSGNLLYGQSFSYTFAKPGVYPYHCIYHDWMYGVVVVKGVSG